MLVLLAAGEASSGKLQFQHHEHDSKQSPCLNGKVTNSKENASANEIHLIETFLNSFMTLPLSTSRHLRHLPNTSRFEAQFSNFNSNRNCLQFAVVCAVLVSAAFASPALTDAEIAISSLSHPHGAQYAFRLSDFAAAESVGEFHLIPVSPLLF